MIFIMICYLDFPLWFNTGLFLKFITEGRCKYMTVTLLHFDLKSMYSYPLILVGLATAGAISVDEVPAAHARGS